MSNTKDYTVIIAYTAKELVAVHRLTNLYLISPETTNHWVSVI